VKSINGRNTDAVTKAVGTSNDLLVVKLDVTSPAEAEVAARAAVDRFGRIDVLVNNAGNFYAGYFEELTPEQIERQLVANLIGPMNVTRAVLPMMRKQRSGHIISISSVRPGGLDGVTAGRDRAIRYQHHHRQSRLHPHGTHLIEVDDPRRSCDRRLR
jgi:NAD(P)-dependent dehydrogenase (short-subunit alcohol dehydrogenase family)